MQHIHDTYSFII